MQRKVEWLLPLAILQGAKRPVTVSEMVIRIQEVRKILGQEPRDFHSIGLKLRPILYRLKRLDYIQREGMVIASDVDFRSAPWSISDKGRDALDDILAEVAHVKRLAES